MTADRHRTERVEALALECLDHIDAEGDSVVDRVCLGDPDLIESVRGVVHELTRVGLLSEPFPSQGGRDLGDFRLLHRLGQGGMGVVWLAEQKSLGRRVALKLLRTGFEGDARTRERFRREGQALSRLDHPGICPVYEAGQVDGTPYLAMRFVDGESLAARLDRRRGHGAGALTAREVAVALDLVEKVARALHTAHEAGVVHRDVKPGNILLDRTDAPVVVDFGLARADDAAQTVLTQGSAPLGTPAYMAPEQLTGKGAIDRRTDVWALGALLYECVTLRTPFVAPTRESLYRQILEDVPDDPRRVTPAAGRDLGAVLTRALEKDPRRRYQTAADFAEELGRLRRHEPVVARAPGPWRRAWRWSRRNRAASAVLVTITLALAVALWLLARADAAELRVRARALLEAASQEQARNPQFAFKLARAAFALGTDDARVLAYTQEVMFELRDHRVIREEERGGLDWVEYSPDGRFLVVTGFEKVPSVHRASDGVRVGRLSQPTTRRRPAIAFAPRSPHVAVGHGYGNVEVFELAEPMGPAVLRFGADRGQGEVARLAFAPDGSTIAAAHWGGLVTLSTHDGRWLRDLQPKASDFGVGIAFLPDGALIAAGAVWPADGSSERVLVAADGRPPTNTFEVSVGATRFSTWALNSDRLDFWRHDGTHASTHARGLSATHELTHAEFAPDGERLVAAYNDGCVFLFDPHGAVQVAHRAHLPGSVNWARFSPDGRWLALAENSGLVAAWDGDRARTTLAGHLGTAFHVSVSPDGREIASAGWDGTARVWRRAAVAGVPERMGFAIPDVAVAGPWTAWTTGKGAVWARGLDGVERTAQVGSGWSHLSVAQGAHTFVVCCEDGTVWTFDPADGRATSLAPRAETMLWDAYVLADQSLVVREGGGLQVMHRDGHGTWSQHGVAGSLTVDRSGTRVLVGGLDGSWRLLELRDDGLDHGLVERARGDGEAGRSIAGLQFSADGERALVSTYQGEVALWQLEPKRRLQVFDLHQHAVHGVAFSPTEDRFATASQDGSVCVQSLVEPRPPIRFTTRGNTAVFRAEFADNQHLVVASSDGTVRTWALTADALSAVLGSIPLGPVTDAERARYPELLK